MDVSAELAKLIPRADEVASSAHSANFLRFLSGLSRADYEAVLSQLGARLTRYHEATRKDEDAWHRFVEFAAYQSILNYSRHRPGSEIIRLLGNQSGLGGDLSRLALMLSKEMRSRLLDELLSGEVKEAERYLESYFQGDRPGIVDYAVELMLEKYHKVLAQKRVEIARGERNPADSELSSRQTHDMRILRAIQARRRRDPKRLPPKPATSYEVRFLTEEVRRELFGYETKNESRAKELISTIEAWYGNSQFLRSTRKNIPIYLVETGFFENLFDVRAKIVLGGTYEPHWDYYIRGALSSEKFWHDISGLNHDVPIESTEAGQRIDLYKRGAVVGGLIFAGLLLLPVTVKFAVAAPGAVIRLVSWTGSRLLLASRYAYTTYKVYGFLGGSAKIVRDAYNYYLQNAVTINQRMIDMVEFFLDIATAGSGMAPGASLADRTRYVTQKMAALTGKTGITRLVSDARQAVSPPDKEVELVKAIVEDADHKLYEVVGRVIGHQDGKIKVARISATEVTGALDDQARKTITFYSKPAKDVDVIPDPRSTLNNGANNAAKATADTKTAAKTDVTAGRKAVDDKVVDLAKRRQEVAEQRRLAAQKEAENLAQRKALMESADRQAVNAGGALDMHSARKTGGGSGDRTVGKVEPAHGNTSVDARSRATGGGDPSKKGKGVNDRANGSHLKSVPAIDPAVLRAARKSPAGYLIPADEAITKPLQQAGFKINPTGIKSPDSGGGKFQQHVSGLDYEWRVTSPSKVTADIDTIAIDPRPPHLLVAVEAKATFVADVGKSAHLRFYPDKVEQLSRQLVICLESGGKMRMEIVVNALPAGETYMNMVAQQVARQIKKDFAKQVKAFAAASSETPIRRLSLDDIEQIVEDHINLVVADWGRLKK
jgi:hypothetical protein